MYKIIIIIITIQIKYYIFLFYIEMLNNFVKEQYKNSHIILRPQGIKGALLLGDFNAAIDKQLLQENNVKTILTAASGMQHLKIDTGIKHITFPLADTKAEKISTFFNDSFNIIQQSLKRGGVLVHCAAGISRSATLVIAYLMKKHKWSFKEGMSFVKKIRSVVCPNLGFQMQLKQYEKQITGSKTQMGRTVLPLRQNIFTIMSEQEDITKQNERGSFPNINPLSRIQSRSKPGQRKILQSRQSPFSNQYDTAKKNLMISTLPGYDNQQIFRDNSLQKSKINSENKLDDAARKLAKIMFSSNMYKCASYNKAYQQHIISLTKYDPKKFQQLFNKKH